MGPQVANPAPNFTKGPKKPKKGKKAKTPVAEVTSSDPAASALLPPAPQSTGEAWSTVAKRGAKKKQGQKAPAQTAAPKKKKKPRRLREPRTAAVVIKLQPGAQERGITYKTAISRASTKRNRNRKTITENYLFK